jgi:hypothetical protein
MPISFICVANHAGVDIAPRIRQLRRLRASKAALQMIGGICRDFSCLPRPPQRQAVWIRARRWSAHARWHLTPFYAADARLDLVAFKWSKLNSVFGVSTADSLSSNIATFYVQLRQEADGFHRTSIVQCINGFLNNLLVLALIKLTFFTTANQKDALRENVRYMMQQQRLTDFSFQFTTAQQGSDVAIADFIELFSNR